VVVYKATVVGNGALTINADPPDFPVPAYAGGGLLLNYGGSTRDRTLPADGASVAELASQAPGLASPATGGATGARPSAPAGPTASGPAVPGWSVVVAVPAGPAAEPAPAGAGRVPNGSAVTPAPAAWAGPVPFAARTPLPATNGRADGGGSDTALTSSDGQAPAEQEDALPIPAVAPGAAAGGTYQRPEGGVAALSVWEPTCDAFFTDPDWGGSSRGALAEGSSSAPNSAAALAGLAVLLGGYWDRRREERGELRRGLLQ
jgi:hypothetical protein